MPVETSILSLENPVFRTYVLAASIMILKLMLQPWLTVMAAVSDMPNTTSEKMTVSSRHQKQFLLKFPRDRHRYLH